MLARFAVATAAAALLVNAAVTAVLLAIAVGQSANAHVPSKQTSVNVQVPLVPPFSTPVAQSPWATSGTVRASAMR